MSQRMSDTLQLVVEVRWRQHEKKRPLSVAHVRDTFWFVVRCQIAQVGGNTALSDTGR
jgi:hypothetical protein